jgi:hypothetical protein
MNATSIAEESAGSSPYVSQPRPQRASRNRLMFGAQHDRYVGVASAHPEACAALKNCNTDQQWLVVDDSQPASSDSREPHSSHNNEHPTRHAPQHCSSMPNHSTPTRRTARASSLTATPMLCSRLVLKVAASAMGCGKIVAPSPVASIFTPCRHSVPHA